jgi:hypothetical protein
MGKAPAVKVFAWYDNDTYPRKEIIKYIEKHPNKPMFGWEMEEARVLAIGVAKNDDKLQKRIMRTAENVFKTSDGSFYSASPRDKEEYKDMLNEL